MDKIVKRDAFHAGLVQKTAETCRVSKRYVRMVINAERESQPVMDTYMTLLEGNNKLLKQVKELVPFN